MARNPIEIPIASETRAFKQGVESGIIDPLEDAEKALEELGRSRGPEQLERDMKDAQRQTEKLADETKDTARTIEREFRDGYRSAKRSADDGLDGMNDKAREVGDELKQNLGETFSSFRGDLEDLPQIAQDTLGGLAGSGALGGIPGLVATAAGAAGIGLLIGAFERLGDEQELNEQKIADWASVYIDSFGGVVSAAQVTGSVIAMSTDPERYKVAAQNAKDWGVDEGTALRAMAGDSAALAAVRETLNTRQEEANRLLAEQETQVDSNAGKAYDLADAVERGAAAYEALTGEMSAGQERARAVSDALRGVVRDAGEASLEVDELGNELYTLPDNTQILIDAKTGQATQNIQGFKGDLDGIPETVNTRVKVDVDSSAWDNWSPKMKRALISYTAIAADKRQLLP
ncbi:hypothetical protein E4V99_14005 [Microbacterium sp. dk485]|uniref:hypothetical protein n=1 Tax=Microbacterium sp. dk485 TaxID=2560021 RepID=UPI0010742929|nr:hypothetical protein [Microbacterium sp. dk485]TFV82043.1 hypothetical protein E4V99_14005 [Microbacterium sp. dk485]